MTQAIEKKTYTPEEYLELEVVSQERHEYVNGEIRLMSEETSNYGDEGSTPNHNDIASNLLVIFKLALKQQTYRTFITDQRLWLPEPNIYTYPDIMVLEQPIQLQSGRTDTVMNPCLMAEVLSKSTKDYDRGEKFLAYRTIETFQEYLLIEQDRVHVEHYVKIAANQWLLSEYSDPKVSLNLSSVNIELKIADLYENIEFSCV